MNSEMKPENIPADSRVKAGILGGAFNPPHKGHIALARAAMEWFSLDLVVFIPSASPPHKMIKGGLSLDDRMLLTAMAVYAAHPDEVERYCKRYEDKGGDGVIQNVFSLYAEKYPAEHDERFLVSDVEREIAPPTYTYDVISSLAVRNPSWDMYLIMGMDQAVVFDSWYRYADLATLARICVAARPGYIDEKLKDRFPFMTVFPFDEIDVSSSELRSHLSDSGFRNEMVPAPVWTLYRMMYGERNA